MTTAHAVRPGHNDDALRAVMRIVLEGGGLHVNEDDSGADALRRVQGLLRRTQSPETSTPTSTPAVVDHGALQIDASAREVTVRGELIELTTMEFDLLSFLAASPRHVFSRDELLREVWASRIDWQDPATVTEHIRRIRRKVEADPAHPRMITTVRSIGYRFEPQPARQLQAVGY
jgi:DNA-binding response OmpR family regulator